jgi:hypothetical protein
MFCVLYINVSFSRDTKHAALTHTLSQDLRACIRVHITRACLYQHIRFPVVEEYKAAFVKKKQLKIDFPAGKNCSDMAAQPSKCDGANPDLILPPLVFSATTWLYEFGPGIPRLLLTIWGKSSQNNCASCALR